ncbi:hypothetical protein [Pedobacter sp.]|uniref:hypothetical protein n=1 Tax=Pedobacter sp. TaxID=1411316 RepID=UPI003BAB9CB4
MKENKKADNLIPTQYLGSKIDVSEKIVTTNATQASAWFRKASERLLDVNSWGSFANLSEFQLTDTSGERIFRTACEKDYIRIDIPGPGTKAGKGYDWVRIEEIRFDESPDEEILVMTVRPSAHPASKDNIPAHFLGCSATSTFLVKRKGLEIFVEEHGRNELINTKQRNLSDTARNFAVGLAAKLGLSYPQWNALVKGILEK